MAPVDTPPERSALADEVLLADELVEVRGRIRAASGWRPGGGRKRGSGLAPLGGRPGIQPVYGRSRPPSGSGDVGAGRPEQGRGSIEPGIGASAAVRRPFTNASTKVGSSWLPAASSRRRRASSMAAPCDTGASSSSPRTRRPRPGSGRRAGCPRRPGRRGSRCRPSARGDGGRRPGRRSMSGRSRTIMSPSATCCLTIVVLVGGERPGLRRIVSGMPILPTSWSSPAMCSGAAHLGVEPEPVGDEERVARDVLGVALGVAVLGVDRDDQALEHVEARRGRACPRPSRGSATRIVSPPLALASRRVTVADRQEELGRRVAVDRARSRCRHSLTGQPLGRPELEARGRPARCAARSIAGSRSWATRAARSTRNSSGPSGPRIEAFGSSWRRMRATSRRAASPAGWPWASLTAGSCRRRRWRCPRRPPAPRLVSSWRASSTTIEPWFSSPVRESRRSASTRAQRLAPEASVGGPEDKVQQDPQGRGREAGQGHDPVAGGGRGCQDRRRVAVDLEDRADVAVDHDRDVLLEDLLEVHVRAQDGRDLAVVGVLDRRRGLAVVEGLGELVVVSGRASPRRPRGR